MVALTGPRTGRSVRVHEELLAGGAKLSYTALTAFCRRHEIDVVLLQEPVVEVVSGAAQVAPSLAASAWYSLICRKVRSASWDESAVRTGRNERGRVVLAEIDLGEVGERPTPAAYAGPSASAVELPVVMGLASSLQEPIPILPIAERVLLTPRATSLERHWAQAE